MSQEDSERLAILQTDIEKYTNMKRSEWIRDGLTDKDWEEYLKNLMTTVLKNIWLFSEKPGQLL